MPDRRAALTLALAGFAFQVAAFLTNALTLSLESPRLAQACALGIALGAGVVVLGCARLARAKGHSGWLGALGILSGLGIAVLHFVVPDRATPSRG